MDGLIDICNRISILTNVVLGIFPVWATTVPFLASIVAVKIEMLYVMF